MKHNSKTNNERNLSSLDESQKIISLEISNLPLASRYPSSYTKSEGNTLLIVKQVNPL